LRIAKVLETRFWPKAKEIKQREKSPCKSEESVDIVDGLNIFDGSKVVWIYGE
jgi:hypothetical protein